jgi:hypothetical protein
MYNPLTEMDEKLDHNLFVNNVKIVLGYDKAAFNGDTILLNTPSGTTYHYQKNNKKEIYARWIHKIDDSHYEVLNEGNLLSGYNIKWYKYHLGYTPPEDAVLDEYGGSNWEPIENIYNILYPEINGIDSNDPCHLIFIPDSS